MGAFLRGFSMFVAVLHILGSVLLLIRMSIGSETSSNNYHGSAGFPVAIILYIKLLVSACLLLKGSIEKRPGLFLYWIIYNCVLNTFVTIATIYLLINIGSVEKNAAADFDGLLSLFIGMTVIVWIKWTLVLLCYQSLKKSSVSHPYSQFQDNTNSI